MNRTLSLITLASLALACGGPSEPPASPSVTSTAPVASVAAAVESAATAASPQPAPVASVAAPAAAPPMPAVRYTGFSTPESVLYDEARDRYLVSNINGSPTDADNNGFISELSPNGKITNLKWIEAGKNKVTLNAPKGLAIYQDTIYVADIDTLRMFDAKTGAPKGETKLAGATFANDVSAGGDGKIYVSDSGLKLEGGDFKPTGTDAVWVIEKGKAKAFSKSIDLSKPNGVVVDGMSILVAPFGANEIYRLDDKGKKSDVTKLPKGMLDGIIKIGDSYFVSSWESQSIYKGKVGGTFEVVFDQLKAPADIGFDRKRNRLLVPRFMENAVEVYDVK
jgi:sugar lactone lactonase YvrE